ncbi:MAG: cobalt transporter CbiM [Candidatus Electrothrix sp. GW3-4]|uniref:cobalt transporter CbiM n=1 Tax=Candidatus Electrothrix sp. GW3-4 TaxID=3126740 RepID=UPI0030CB6B6D
MHISEGILSAPVLLSGGIIAAIGTYIGLKKIDLEQVMPVALLSSAFFVAGLVHVPLGPGSVHLMLIGLLGVMLGWAAFPAILIALFLQALFFQFGGFAVLGVNTVTMATPALCCYYLTRSWMNNPKTRPAAAFLAGFLAILLASLLTACALALTDTGFTTAAQLIIAANVPVMIIEGSITMFTVGFLAKVQPEILHLNYA